MPLIDTQMLRLDGRHGTSELHDEGVGADLFLIGEHRDWHQMRYALLTMARRMVIATFDAPLLCL